MPNAEQQKAYDGILVSVAQDAQTNPSDLPPQFLSVTINRKLRGGRNDTRDSFVSIKIKAAPSQDPQILEDFRTGNFQGAFPYKAQTLSAQDGIAVSVAGVIYYIAITNGVGLLYKLIEGNDPTMMHTWFCQAEDWLYIQNSRQNAIAWNGSLDGSVADLRAQGLGSPDTPFIATATRARTSNVATITTANDLGLIVGDYVQVENMKRADLNGLHQVTAASSGSFSFLSIGPNIASAADATGRAKKYIGQIELTWSDNSTNEDHYELEYFHAGEATTIELPANTTEYQFGPAAPNDVYSFRIRAVYADGSRSVWSNGVTTTSNNLTPTAELPPAISRLNPYKNEMPIGNIMCYAYGRVLVADNLNNIYASNIIYGNGTTVTSNTRYFTETQYWNEGGSFTPPSDLGAITGMIVSPSININDRGQGEVVVACELGFFTLNTSITRTEWLLNNIQKTSLKGRGNQSPWSLTLANNEIFFRSQDGWSFYNNSQVDFTQTLSFRNISKEVNPWVSEDTPWLQQFASAMFFDNRLIATVSPFTIATEDGRGLHRPCRGMVVMDVDKSAAAAPDADLVYRWNGIWEGPQPTQMIAAQINRVHRGFCFSYDSDGVNRIYEIQKNMVDDMVDGNNVEIKSSIISRRMDFGATQKTNDFLYKTLTGGEVLVSGLTEEIDIDVYYRPDNYPVFQEWASFTVGCDDCNEETECDFEASNPRSYTRRCPSPKQACQPGAQTPINQGREFQFRIDLSGRATIDRFRVQSFLSPMDDLSGDCKYKPIDCSPITGCNTDVFNFYRIV